LKIFPTILISVEKIVGKISYFQTLVRIYVMNLEIQVHKSSEIQNTLVTKLEPH